MSHSPYIDDGYTLSSDIVIPGLKFHPIHITYRPLNASSMAEVQDRTSSSGHGELLAKHKVIADNLRTWDVKDGNGNAVPIKPETVGKLHSYAFTAIWNEMVLPASVVGEREGNSSTAS